MDILPLDGRIREKPEIDGHWTLEIPIAFTHVSTGPQGILQFTIESRDLAVSLVGEQTVHPFSPSAMSVATVGKIASRPIVFQDEQNGSNRLVFVSDARPAPGHESLPETLRLAIKLTLSNHGFVRIPITATSVDGVLEIRTDEVGAFGRVLPLLNLSLIASGVLLLHEVLLPDLDRLVPSPEEEPYLPTRAALQTGLGVLLSFLGLSIGRLRSLFSFITNPMGIFKWPELHLEPVLLRLFRSPLMAILLGVMFVAELMLIHEIKFPIPEPPPGSYLMHRGKRLEIEGKERVAIRRGRRTEDFTVYCGENGFPLGNLGPKGYRWKTLSVHDDRSLGAQESKAPLSTMEVLRECSSQPAAGLHCDLKKVICGEKEAPEVRLSEIEEGYDVRLQPHPSFPETELVDLIKNFRIREIKEKHGPASAFQHRQELANELAQRITVAVSSKAIDRETVASVLISLVRDMGAAKPKVVIERAILIQGLLTFVMSESSSSLVGTYPQDAGSRLAAAFKQSAGQRVLNTLEFAATAEVAVELSTSRLASGLAHVFHQAIETKIPKTGPIRIIGILRYARAFILNHGARIPDAPQYCYFASVLPDVKDWDPRFRQAISDLGMAEENAIVRKLSALEENDLSLLAAEIWTRCPDDERSEGS